MWNKKYGCNNKGIISQYEMPKNKITKISANAKTTDNLTSILC